MNNILIGLVILFFVLIWILVVKYLFIPLTQPKLRLKESIDFLEKKNCAYITHTNLNKSELRDNHFNRKNGISFKKALSSKSEFKIIGYSENENLYKLYWIEITFWWFSFGKGVFESLTGDKIEKRRELKYIEETDLKLLENLSKDFDINTVTVSNECPACGFKISPNDLECEKCGLIYRS